MTIFLASAASVACAFYLYVLIQFVQDRTRISHKLSEHSEPAGLGDCPSH